MADTSVLFVDDEPNVLQGIRRMLRHKRHAWTMHFAGGGREALALMAQTPVDVLVTDMRMPEMDGAALLEAVQKDYPDTARFVLSGQCDEETALRAAVASHQYLSKPCDAEMLEEKIDRALAGRSTLATEPLRRLMSSLSSVPTPPSVYLDLMAELEKSHVSADRIDEIVGRDPGLTAKLLQICNSSYFGLASTVRSIHQAVSFLGVDTVKALALQFGIVGQMSRTHIGACEVSGFIDHCLATACLARRMVQDAGLGQTALDEAYTAGLMHDIGVLVLAENMGDSYDVILRDHGQLGSDLSKAEAQALGADHAAVAGYLLGAWGLPAPIVQAVADHHIAERQCAERMTPSLAVYLAALLIEEFEEVGCDGVLEGRLIDPALRAAPAVAEGLSRWCGEIRAGREAAA